MELLTKVKQRIDRQNGLEDQGMNMRYCTPFRNFEVGLIHGTYTRASWFRVTYNEVYNTSWIEMTREEYEGPKLTKKHIIEWEEKGDANPKFRPDSRVEHFFHDYTNVYLRHEKSVYEP